MPTTGELGGRRDLDEGHPVDGLLQEAQDGADPLDGHVPSSRFPGYRSLP